MTIQKGAIAEYKASIWLLEQGYEVYRNVSPAGPVDLIAIKDGQVIEIDVKTLQITGKHNDFVFSLAKLSDKQRARGIRVLWVYEDQIGWNRDYFIPPSRVASPIS